MNVLTPRVPEPPLMAHIIEEPMIPPVPVITHPLSLDENPIPETVTTVPGGPDDGLKPIVGAP